MDKQRHDFSLTFELLSDLHLGDGDTRDLTLKDPTKKAPQVATIARDHNKLPWLPGTSLKGAIRAISGADEATTLFGSANDADNGQAGLLTLWGGTIITDTIPTAQQCKLAHYSPATASYVGTHVSIAQASGSADSGKLYSRDYVPKGVGFTVDCCWQGAADELDSLVLPLLNRLASPFGFALGKASRAGFGRIRLTTENCDVISQRLVITDNMPSISETTRRLTISPDEASDVETMNLHCPGPFLIVDPNRAGEGGEGDHVDMRTVQRDATIPELLGTSLIGVLRSRSSWLQQLHLRQPPDDPAAKYGGDPDKLSSTQRLFGINGWAKRFRLIDITMTSCGSPQHVYPGVVLDDFTQGVVPGKLFAVEAPGDIRFRIHWTADQQGLCQDDDDLLALLAHNIATRGLKIGHRTGVGFGWFHQEVSSGQEA